MYRLVFLFALCFLLKAQAAPSLTGKQPPLWELGVGFVQARLPHYPGADQYNNWTLPIPAILYRGKVFRTDREGRVRGRIFQSDFVVFDVSFGGSMPSKSKNNTTRSGMPDLDTIFEMGPALTFHFKRIRPESPWRLFLQVPVRHTISTDFTSIKDRGFVFNPWLSFAYQDLFFKKSITWVGLSHFFTSGELMDYLYEVAPEYVRINRPAYNAKSGYIATTLSLSMSYSISNSLTVFGGGVYSHYKGATNLDSPLHVQQSNLALGAGLIFWFYESKTRGVR